MEVGHEARRQIDRRDGHEEVSTFLARLNHLVEFNLLELCNVNDTHQGEKASSSEVSSWVLLLEAKIGPLFSGKVVIDSVFTLLGHDQIIEGAKDSFVTRILLVISALVLNQLCLESIVLFHLHIDKKRGVRKEDCFCFRFLPGSW